MSNFHTAKQLKPSQLTNFRTQRFNVTFRARWFGGWTKGGVWWGSFLAEKHNLSDLLKENLESTFKWLKKHKKHYLEKPVNWFIQSGTLQNYFVNFQIPPFCTCTWIFGWKLVALINLPKQNLPMASASSKQDKVRFLRNLLTLFVWINPCNHCNDTKKKPGLSCFDSQEIWWIFGSEGLELGIRHLSSAFLWWVWLRSMHLKSI